MNTKTDQLAARLRGVDELSEQWSRRPAEALSSSDARVGVKALEWVEVAEGPRCITVCGMYAIHPSSGTYGKPTLTLTGMPGNLFGKFDTLDEAKAAAQSDYETRILSALAPTSGESKPALDPTWEPRTRAIEVDGFAPASPEKDEPVAWTEPPKLSKYELAAIEKQIEKLGDWIEINHEEQMQADAEQDRESGRALALVASVFVDAYNRLNTIKWVVEGKKPPSELTAPPSLAEAVAALKAARPFVHRVANGETFRGTRDDAQSALAKIDAFEIEGGRS